MADKDLEFGLRIKADTESGRKAVQNVADSLDSVRDSARSATSEADKLDDALSQSAQGAKSLDEALDQSADAAQNAGAKYAYAGQSVFSLRDDFGGAATATKALDSALNASAATAQNAAAKYTYAGQSTFSLRENLQRTTAAARLSTDEVNRLLLAYDGQAQSALRLAADEKRLKAAFDQGAISSEQYRRSIANLHQANRQLTDGYRNFRAVAANVGYQVQDIAVQMQMGTRPATIFAQQGSQLVSAFNPLAGAIIAVAGGLAGALLPSLFSANDAAESLNDTIRELNKEYETLDEAQRKQLINEQQIKQEGLREEISQTTDSIDKLTARLNALREAQSRGVGAPQPGTAIMGLGSAGAGYAATAERVLEAERALDQARADLVTKNQLLGESEKEIDRIRGQRDVEKDNKNADELIKRLQEQVDTYKLTGTALGEYVAASIYATGARRDDIIALYEQIEAQKEANKQEAEAAAEKKRQENADKAKLKSAQDYVVALERQAEIIGLSSQQLGDYEAREKGVTGALLERARAAQLVIDAEKQRQQLQAESIKLAELEVQLLRAQGREQEAAQLEFQLRYQKFLDGLSDENRQRGKQLVSDLINLEELRAQLSQAEQEIDRVLQNQQQQETSINAQREAGLITEAEARRRIVELHRETYAELERQRPLLEELAQQPGEVGQAAGAALAQLNAQSEQLRYTLDLFQATLRNTVESGLTEAIFGLTKGTITFRDAIRDLGTAVLDAMIRIQAQELAQTLTKSAFGSGGGSGGGDNGWVGTAVSAIGSYFGFNDGGAVNVAGAPTTHDSIPAMLTNKEFVVRNQVTRQPSAESFLHDFNARGMAALADWAPAYHNTGGLAGVPAPAMPSPTMGNAKLAEPAAAFSANLTNSQNFYLVDDPQRIGDIINSDLGKNSMIVQISRDPQKFKQAMKLG